VSPAALDGWNDLVEAMVRSGELAVRSTAADPMVPGRTHQRLQQYYRGRPVIGAELTRQLDRGLAMSIFGAVHTGIALEAAPAIGADEAARIAARFTDGGVTAGRAPVLAVLPLDDGGYALAWMVETRPPADRRTCFVDATSGRVLLDFSTLKPGLPAGDEEAAALGDMSGRAQAHAALERYAGLVYRRESGALAEAYADIVAVSVAASEDRAAVRPDTGDGRDPWVIRAPAAAGGPQSLRDPARFGAPDHYSGVDAGAAIRTSAMVAGHAFYLAVEGGVNRTSGLAVEGVGAAGRVEVEKSVTRAFLYLLPAAATFSTARAATIQSAIDLYGPESAVVRAIGEAWAAVGVR
jgi:Zn-dependent metalloprotease